MLKNCEAACGLLLVGFAAGSQSRLKQITPSCYRIAWDTQSSWVPPDQWRSKRFLEGGLG